MPTNHAVPHLHRKRRRRRQFQCAATIRDLAESRKSHYCKRHKQQREIRAETSQAQPNAGRLKQLLFTTVTAIAATFGQAAGTDLAHLASQALQTL
jgi:hypothetical protein